jgi:hypothetical protein
MAIAGDDWSPPDADGQQSACRDGHHQARSPTPDGDPWRERFRPFELLSAYATAFRYSLSPSPNVDDLRRMLASLISLHEVARAELLTT